MAEAAAAPGTGPKKRRKLPLLLGVALALAGGGGAFYATWSGILLGVDTAEAANGEAGGDGDAPPLGDIAFVAVTPVIISLGPGAASRHLRMTAQLEVGAGRSAEVTQLLPRILDVLNGYLRAVEVAELEDPAALVRIRAQLLRRIQIVTGEGRVRDLLVTEFVLN